MNEKLKELYILGKKAQLGDEDCYQYIIERLIKGIKKYKF